MLFIHIYIYTDETKHFVSNSIKKNNNKKKDEANHKMIIYLVWVTFGREMAFDIEIVLVQN
jgi:hypothetical protein